MAHSQEFNCNVVINADAADNIDKRVIEDMKRNIQEFINLRRWTEDKFSNQERISFNLIITFTEPPPSVTQFVATAQIQSARPVYGTNYETVLLNFVDKQFNFEYTEGQPLEFIENSYRNHLTSLLAFYAYVILGYDYDSFSKNGGKDFYLRANQVLGNATSSNYQGWQAFEGTQNRYWLIENLMSAQMAPFREGVYNYHRLGLDVMLDKPDDARVQVLDMLKKIQTVKQVKPVSVVINAFFEAKNMEIVNIFSEGSPQEKQQAFAVLEQIDPPRREKYMVLTK